MARDGQVPWPPSLMAEYTAKGYWRGVTLGSLVGEWADRYGPRTALVDGDRRIAYTELAALVDTVAVNLVDLGLRDGDAMLVQLQNCWEFVVTTLAAIRVGVVPVMALPTYRERELTHLAAHVEAAAIVVPAVWRRFDYQDMALRLTDSLPHLRHVLVVGDPVSSRAIGLHGLLSAEGDAQTRGKLLDDLAPRATDVALMLMSGGTTGLPKMIARTHNDYEYNARRSGEVSGLGPETVYLTALPVGHNFPLGSPGVLGTLMVGGRVVLLPSPEPRAAFAAIERERVTVTSAVPAVVQRWLEYYEPGRHDLSSLELIQVGGARLAPEVALRVTPRLGCRLQQVFGMAEGLINYTGLDDPSDVVAETQGRPMCPDDEIRIVDDDGADVPEGLPGELLTRGPYTPRGYFRGGVHNAQSFTPDGWYRTGDVVRLHPSGNLVVEGRKKDLINRAGEKVSAQELEDVLYGLPWVARAAVVGVPDDEVGERVCVCVVTSSGTEPGLAEVRAEFADRGFALYKFPERIEFFDELPLTDIGKPDKKRLRVLLAERQKA
ncbi:(2,3-dihydroxybenzoyl)adenylate synthase [Actinoallomurus liliacearum]